MSLAVRFLRPCAVCALSLAATLACVKPERVPLVKEATPHVTASQVVVGIRQHEVGTTIHVSRAGNQFGLIGALIDTGVNKSRAHDVETAVKGIRDSLLDFTPEPLLASALKDGLAALPWLRTPNAVSKPQEPLSTLAEWQAMRGEQVLVYVQPQYAFSPDFRTLRLRTFVSMHPAGGKPAEKAMPISDLWGEKYPNAIYFSYFISTQALPTTPATQEQVLADWAADKGKRVREAMQAAIRETVELLIWDLDQPGPEGDKAYEPPAGTPWMTREIDGFVRRAFLVRSPKGRAWYRMEAGFLEAVPAL